MSGPVNKDPTLFACGVPRVPIAKITNWSPERCKLVTERINLRGASCKLNSGTIAEHLGGSLTSQTGALNAVSRSLNAITLEVQTDDWTPVLKLDNCKVH